MNANSKPASFRKHNMLSNKSRVQFSETPKDAWEFIPPPPIFIIFNSFIICNQKISHCYYFQTRNLFDSFFMTITMQTARTELLCCLQATSRGIGTPKIENQYVKIIGFLFCFCLLGGVTFGALGAPCVTFPVGAVTFGAQGAPCVMAPQHPGC